jgi:hypothetical protein
MEIFNKKVYMNKSIIKLCSIGAAVFLCSCMGKVQEKGKYKKSIEHINFGGRIAGKIDLFDYYFISEVDLSYSNCSIYDIRDSSDVWSFVIKSDKAEILSIDSIDDEVEVGDSIAFDGKNIYYYRDDANYPYKRDGAIIFNIVYNDDDIRGKHKL